MTGNLMNRPNNRTNLCQITEKTRITNLQINNSSLPKITRNYRFHTILHLKNHQNFKGVTPFYRFIKTSLNSSKFATVLYLTLPDEVSLNNFFAHAILGFPILLITHFRCLSAKEAQTLVKVMVRWQTMSGRILFL